MLERKAGSVINMASIGGIVAVRERLASLPPTPSINFLIITGNINGQDMHPGIQRFKSRADILTDDTARVGKDKSYLEDNGVIAKTVTDAVVAALANHAGGLGSAFSLAVKSHAGCHKEFQGRQVEPYFSIGV